MKFRSFLLFACMVVVPMLAMFSHKIPPSLRQSVRERLWNPMQGMAAQLFDGEAVASPPIAAAVPPLPLPPSEPAPAPTTPTPARRSAAAPAPAPTPAPAIRSIASEQRTIEIRLAELGAFAFDCAPVADGGGLHRCSCRVAADSSGQLQRVFQAADRDPVAAMQNLLGQVQSWKDRLAAAPGMADSPLTGDPVRTLRF